MKTSVKIIILIVAVFGIFYFKDDIIEVFTEPAKKTTINKLKFQRIMNIKSLLLIMLLFKILISLFQKRNKIL